MTALEDRLGTSPAAVVVGVILIWCCSVGVLVTMLMMRPIDPPWRWVLGAGFALWTFVALPSLARYRLHVLRDQAIEARRRNGCCQSCGYDLRASPDRCPECGEEVPSEAKTWE
jgi:hypothetical protein